jgi:hypothetical protein
VLNQAFQSLSLHDQGEMSSAAENKACDISESTNRDIPGSSPGHFRDNPGKV